MIRNVFLDLDDTILDFHAAEHVALSATLTEMGVEPTPAVLKRYGEINRGCWQKLERLELTRTEVLHERFRMLYEELGACIDPVKTQATYEYRLSLEHPFMEGGAELLDALYGKYRLYLASNGTAAVQDRRIADTGIAKYFDAIFISQRVGHDKPSREFFDACFASDKDLSPSQSVIVGDSLTSDIQGGLNYGMLTCYFNPHGRENLTGIKPDYEIRSLGELPELLRRI